MKPMNKRPSGVPQWYAIDKSQSNSEATVYIYAEIGDSFFGDSVSAADFVRDVGTLDVETINLHLNSPGGDVFDGIAISNVIRNHKARVNVTVDGLAASAASFIAISGDELVMAPHSELMIHDAWGIGVGNAATMAKLSKDLDRVSNNIASMYAAKAGPEADWRASMQEETWFSAEEAVIAGLADRVGTKVDKKATAVSDLFDRSIFAHRSRADAPTPQLKARQVVNAAATTSWIPNAVTTTAASATFTLTPAPHPPAEPAEHPNPTTEGPSDMSDTLTSGLRERLGIPADADLDEAGLLSALDEVLNEQPQPTNEGHTLPQGIVAVEEGVLATLRRDAELGREAREQQLGDHRANLVDSAIKDGRIPPARRDHWVAYLAADQGAAAVLDTLAPGIVPLAPLGYVGGVSESSDDDSLYERLYGKAV